MRSAQLITYGVDDDAAAGLQTLVSARGVALAVTRHVNACLNLMRQGAVGVLLLRVGKDLHQELALLDQVAEHFPHVAPVVWGDAEHPRLAGLAWDLGARAVLLPATDLERLHDIILRLLPE